MKRVRKALRQFGQIHRCTCQAKQMRRYFNLNPIKSHSSEQNCDRFFALASDILCIAGFDGRFKRLSAACEPILGFSPQQLLDAPFMEFIHLNDQAATADVIKQLVRGERVDHFENRYRCRDGSYKWLEWSGIGVVEEELIYCTARDITLHKQAEEKLQKSKHQYGALIHSLNGIIWEFNLVTQQFEFVSQKAEYVLGYPVEQWSTETGFWENHIHPEDREWVINSCGQFVVQRQEGQLEYRMIAADGSIVWLHDIVSLVLEDDQPTKLRGVLIDISDRKRIEAERLQIEQAFRSSEQRFRTLSQCAPVGIYLANEKGECTYVNDRWSEWTQLASEKAYGLGWADIIHPEDQQRVFDEWNAAIQQKREFVLEYRYLRPDGVTVWVNGRAIALRDETGNISGFIGTVSDITERKQAELARQESEARFQAFMQHIPAAAWISNAAGQMLQANPTWLKMVRLTAAEAIGKTLFDIFPTALAQQYLDNNHWVIQSNQMIEFIESAPLEDGSLGEYLVYKFPIQTGEEYCLVGGVAVDITKLKRTEAALRESEERFRQIAESIREVFWVADIKFTQLFYVSPAYEEIWGRTCESLYQQPKSFVEAIHPEDRARTLLVMEQNRLTGFKHEYRIIQPDGSIRWIWERAFAVNDITGQPYRVVGISQDITERKQAEEALRLADFSFERSAVGAVWIGSDARVLRVNEGACQMLGYSREELQAKYVYEVDPNFLKESWAEHWQTLRQQQTITFTSQLQHKDGSLVPIETTLNYLEFNGKEYNFAFARDISQRLAIEAELRQQTERERLVKEITHHIRQSLNLDEILNTTVTEVQQFLQTDRVVICQFNPDWSGTIVAEKRKVTHPSMLGQVICEPGLTQHEYAIYQAGEISAIADLKSANVQPSYHEFLTHFEVQASLVVPILHEKTLWGLLIAYHCASPRTWQNWETRLLSQLAEQLAITIQQAELHQQVQQLNALLETQVQERTLELRQALNFEALLKRITDKVRDSLDETQILQTAVQELGRGLSVQCCDTALYDFEAELSTITCEYITSDITPIQNLTFPFSNLAEVHEQLLQGRPVQFCALLMPHPRRCGNIFRWAILSCPLMDDQGVLGDLWLFRGCEDSFSEAEIRLVEQVANQCAIALRQSRLYQISQAQVVELEQLNQLKDDFLSTVSHELRTPMSNMRMAIQMLEISLPTRDISDAHGDRITRYFNILKNECRRETNLINNLLDLTRLDAGTDPLNLVTIDLPVWLAQMIEPFEGRVHNQNQQLHLKITSSLPPITTEIAYLEHILTELLNNACKYTPPHEKIYVSASIEATTNTEATPNTDILQIEVTNSGVEIPKQELSRVFEKFYRIPKNDPWKHGGTGLGLALVKRLVERLHGTIEVSSKQSQTTFTIRLPLLPAPN
ncbi:MAG TPA: PAS domain S-box protein [Leptolyngbyaceae cyanobacterium M33_DOE_097]|uniref:histidine kinase n=1 Tax=Oscillatoriales cyanobacterium SpSt-418 TaxID=2282169 RepID=A0A7C3KF13_9CYAN|nr:PAS domain S-box protein [Leptolyngbyaceae cyanobacterium M33_DOE_097]